MLDVAKCYKMGHILAKPGNRIVFHVRESYSITDEVKSAWMMTFSKAQFWILFELRSFIFIELITFNLFAGNLNFC